MIIVRMVGHLFKASYDPSKGERYFKQDTNSKLSTINGRNIEIACISDERYRTCFMMVYNQTLNMHFS